MDDARFWISLPIVSVALAALIPFAVPTFRWSKTLQRDVQIWKDFPPGDERAALEEWITFQARRLRHYRSALRYPWMVAAWGFTLLCTAAVILSLIFGLRVEGSDWILLLLVAFDAVFFIPLALAGRVIFGWRAGDVKNDEIRSESVS